MSNKSSSPPGSVSEQSHPPLWANKLGIGTCLFGTFSWITTTILLSGRDPPYAFDLLVALTGACVILSSWTFVSAIRARKPLMILYVIPAISFAYGIWQL